MAGMSGTIYAAHALLSLSGNATLANPLDVGMLNLSGNVALSQIAAGSDGSGDASGIANTLLAGNLSVYINDPSGLFTADELARIEDAINAWDAILAPYSVMITEVTDPSQANLIIDTGSTSACGGAALGVLGCFNEPNGEITMLQGWNWYAGADPGQIGANQYDFETTVLHELGHALGLGGSTNPASPMYEVLAAGVADRTPTTQDLNIPDPPDGADPQMAAGIVPGSAAVASQPGVAAAEGPARNAGPVGLAALPSGGGPASAVDNPGIAAHVQVAPQGIPAATRVLQGADREERHGLAPAESRTGLVFDAILADLTGETDRPRGDRADGAVVAPARPAAEDAEDGRGQDAFPVRTGPEPSPVPDAVLDDLAADTAGWPVGDAQDPMVRGGHDGRDDRGRTPDGGCARLAGALVLTGLWAHPAGPAPARGSSPGRRHRASRGRWTPGSGPTP